MANRLAGATSPYLRQHAANPVDWYPWGSEALQRARDEDKPILLSIGYSACHWCHVMAHESFEDPAVAAVMNDLFVNIKVDREERPDLDQICQTAHALLAQRSGGWPLTMFLTPAGAPYFAGTYFPNPRRGGQPGFLDLLPRMASAYRLRGEDIARQSASLAEAMAVFEPAVGGDLDAQVSTQMSAQALAALKQRFDPEYGGFGAAPKFPHPTELEFCLRAWGATHDEAALTVARTTLSRMADGGIHDQLGGGFCRYSVDAQWTIPHFEKMLYDNGPLLGLYADLARATGDQRYADVARDIVGWLVREMRAPDGAFYSSLDADSEGEEGKFYVWTPDQARAAVTPDEWAVASPYFGLDRPPNFEGHAWNLHVAQPLDKIAAQLGIAAAGRTDPPRRRAGGVVRGARGTHPAGTRRQDPDRVECACDRRARARRTCARRAALVGTGVCRRRFAQAHRVARRAVARHALRRSRRPERLSRRLRLPSGRARSNCCRRDSGWRTSPGRASSRMQCSRTSRMASAADFSSPATTTRNCSIAPSPGRTTPRRRAMASRPPH